MYLVDTNVLSEARRGTPAAVTWIRSVDPAQVYLSVISLGEITRGITQKARTDPTFARTLDLWLSTLQRDHAARILAVDDQVAREWGRMSADRTRATADTLIAATASVHRKTLVTRNVSDFVGLDIILADPWDAG